MASQEQMARAARCAGQLTARTPVPHSLYRVLLVLVESVERPFTKAELVKPPPVSDARKVLAPKKSRPRRAAVQPCEEGLW